MGIERYFTQAKPASNKKEAAPPKKKPTAKAKNKEDDDFQPDTTSKAEKQAVDPKAFFSSKKSSSSKPAATKSAKIKDLVVSIEAPKETKPKETKAKETKPKETKPRSTASKATAAKKTTGKPATKKRPLSDDDSSDDDFKDDKSEDDQDEDENDYEEEDDYEEEEKPRPQKKAKKASSPEPVAKKTPTKKASTTKKSTDADKKEVKEEAKATEDAPKPNPKRNYFAMLKNKEPPKALGTRPEPVGAPNCLQGLAFVISGQFETLTQEQTKDIIMRYGGRVTTAVSGKTNYLCRGRDAGESKMSKAKALGTKVIDEDGFYDFIESFAEKKPKNTATPSEKPTEGKEKGKAVAPATPVKAVAPVKSSGPSSMRPSENNATLLWTEKYKPTDIKDIIGNKELVRRIDEWLGQWQENLVKGFKGVNTDNINDWRAVLISGPPGIGKTTTASLVAKNNGYEPLEFNASDVRSKKILEESISEMMDNRTMTEFFKAGGNTKKEDRLLKGKKVVLIMDEVDGMSSGDRGGSAELASLIRKSKIPVICICNDVRSTKVAPLLRVCFQAKFRRTSAPQIRSRIMSIAFKEGLKIQPNAIDALVNTTQNDIRQIINILSTYRLNETDMDYDKAKQVGKSNQKHSILGLFDIPLELLTTNGWRSKTLSEKSEVYFHDYALSNLIIEENYLKCNPELATSASGNRIEEACNEMDLIAKAAEAIADGDLVDTMIHGTVQHWSLMPVHSIFSCVRPASYVRGQLKGRIDFPKWLGQNSKAGKYSRALSDVQTRMRLKASGDKFEIRQNYIPTLNDRIFGELKEENFEGAIEVMDTYYLDRENLDTLSELSFDAAGKGPLTEIPTRAKTAFTRAYNGQNHPILFQIGGAPIKKSVSGPREDAVGLLVLEDEPIGDDLSEQEDEQEDEDELEDVKKYLKAPSKKRKPTATASGSGSGSRATKKTKTRK